MLALNRKEFIVFLQKTKSKIRMEGREKYLTFLGLVSAVFFFVLSGALQSVFNDKEDVAGINQEEKI